MRMRCWKALPFALALAGCGSPSGGARLEGMLDPASLAATQGEPVQVSVADTTRATATDASGRFGFEGLNPGNATLRFRGRGFDVRVRVAGLEGGQTLEITVEVGASGCVVRRARENEIALVGAISAVGASSIAISGVEVTTDASTRIDDRGTSIALSDLHAGDVVRVEGTLQTGGKVLAREIDRLPPPAAAAVLLRGAVGSIDTAKSTFTVSGLTIATDASTRFAGGAASLADLKVGDRVLVQGTVQSDGTVKARLVVEVPAAPRDRDERDVEGRITATAPPDRFEVAGKTVVVDSSTRLEGEHDARLTFADLRVGDAVEVEGVAQADGTFLAREIKRDDDEEHEEQHP
jgi:Domain of unknown function (DUF5666)/Carboxypeptidase regulatory-like domain